MHDETSEGFDLVVVGAGIVGLAHAWSATRRGLRVAVVERDHRCVGASIRNFGFVTVTGQRAGLTWQRARRSRERWLELSARAGIAVQHRGLWVLARRPQAQAVLEAFMGTPMATECALFSAAEAAALAPALRTTGACAALHSTLELRVESREAIPRLAQWLAEEHGVRFFHGETVLAAESGRVQTAMRTLRAERTVICPGTDLGGVAARWLAPYGLQLTRLQMLRVRPEAGFRLPGAVMGDLSLVRYGGYAALPEARALREALDEECPAWQEHGIHLIAVQSADGSLVVGDSHHDDPSPEPFAQEAVDRLILQQLRETVEMEQCEVLERWTGLYPVGHDEDALVLSPEASLRVVLVTSGTGASTAFALADDVFEAW